MDKQKFRIIAGIELETEYSLDELNEIDVSSYHSRREYTPLYNNHNFRCESDGSLDTSSWSDNGDCVEIISSPIDLEEIDKVIDNLRGTFEKEAKSGGELNKLLNFNTSCGCHIHLTFLRDKDDKIYEIFDNMKKELHEFKGEAIPIKNYLSVEFVEKFRKILFKKVSKELPNISKKFKKHYFRQHAKKFNNPKSESRYREFNTTTTQNEHIEFRSFNLRGVKTWEQMKTMFKLLRESLYEVLEKNVKEKVSIKAEVKNV